MPSSVRACSRGVKSLLPDETTASEMEMDGLRAVAGRACVDGWVKSHYGMSQSDTIQGKPCITTDTRSCWQAPLIIVAAITVDDENTSQLLGAESVRWRGCACVRVKGFMFVRSLMLASVESRFDFHQVRMERREEGREACLSLAHHWRCLRHGVRATAACKSALGERSRGRRVKGVELVSLGWLNGRRGLGDRDAGNVIRPCWEMGRQ